MIERCYAEKFKYKHPSYDGCEVCEEWLNYQEYAEWYHTNYYKVGNERMQVDKDILNTGNRVYSPDNCIIVPQSINLLFVNKFNNGILQGIQKNNKGFRVEFKGRKVGVYSTLEEAMLAYGKMRKKNVVDAANRLRSEIPNEIYQTICNWDETSMLALI